MTPGTGMSAPQQHKSSVGGAQHQPPPYLSQLHQNPAFQFRQQQCEGGGGGPAAGAAGVTRQSSAASIPGLLQQQEGGGGNTAQSPAPGAYGNNNCLSFYTVLWVTVAIRLR